MTMNLPEQTPGSSSTGETTLGDQIFLFVRQFCRLVTGDFLIFLNESPKEEQSITVPRVNTLFD